LSIVYYCNSSANSSKMLRISFSVMASLRLKQQQFSQQLKNAMHFLAVMAFWNRNNNSSANSSKTLHIFSLLWLTIWH